MQADVRGGFAKRVRVASGWRYSTTTEMFHPGGSVIGINVMQKHDNRTKVASIYDLMRKLASANLVEWYTEIGDGVVPGISTERVLPQGTYITTALRNVFEVLREVGRGSNATVYEARTVSRNYQMSYIPDSVVLKVGNKKQFHEQMVYEAVEALRASSGEDAALIRYYDFSYVAGYHIMVLEDIKGMATQFSDLDELDRWYITQASEFVQAAAKIALEDVTGPGNIMAGTRSDLRSQEYFVYLVDLDPFGQVM